jgi:hypothetical protein
MEVLKTKNVEMSSLNQIRNSKESITDKLDHEEERILGLKIRLRNYDIQIATKGTKCNHKHYIQDLWDILRETSGTD